MVLWRGREGFSVCSGGFREGHNGSFQRRTQVGLRKGLGGYQEKSRLVSGRTQLGIRKDSGGCQKNPMDLGYCMSSRAFGPGLSLWPPMTRSWKALGLELL